MEVTRVYCTSTNSSCWPTTSDVQALSNALDPTLNRTAYWINSTNSSNGELNPFVTAVPYYSPNNEPFFGAAKNMQPVYSRSDYNYSGDCFSASNPSGNMYCFLSTRNNP